ncbi:fas-binding factor 1 isoform X1 [Erinaceus europaeus]|uniref:Fas-binding factor 1 isoform X1 n=1 Tax=Erinaceus europaeus TaxID=9365 RepID=A0ABM3YCF8_ERIEU|nr:fas-binding factor 1 isoform X1 [Erinaceus europaeus]
MLPTGLAPKTKKGLKDSIDNVLADLLGDDMTLPEKPVKPASRARDATGEAQTLSSSRPRTKSLLEDNAFSTVAGLAEADAEVSDISEADPHVLLKTIKDLDDLDADILGLQKPNRTSSKRTAKGSGKEEVLRSPKHPGDTSSIKKPPSYPSSFGHQHKKFPFEDLEDPLAGLLSDEEEELGKKLPETKTKPATEKSSTPLGDQGPSGLLTPGDTPIRKKEETLFDDEDDIMATLGFGDSPTSERRQTGDQEGPRPARSKLDELLGRGTATKLLARPVTGERREFKLDKKYMRPQDKEDAWDDEDFTFGAYQPTLASSEGRQSRRQSISRFLAEGGADLKGEPGSKQSTPVASSPTHPRKGGADWLGLKDDDSDLLPPSPTRETGRGGSALSTTPGLGPKSQPSTSGQNSAPAGLPSSLGTKPPTRGTGSPAKAIQTSKYKASEEKGEEDWLSQALSRKKSRDLTREECPVAAENLTSVRAAGRPISGSQPAALTQELEPTASGGSSGTAAQKPSARPDPVFGAEGVERSPMTVNQPALALHASEPQRPVPRDLSSTEPAVHLPSSQEPPWLSVPVQVWPSPLAPEPEEALPSRSISLEPKVILEKPLLPEPLARSLLPGTEYQKQLLAAQAQLQSGTAELQAQLLQNQARLAELEAQVRKLELERAQQKLLLESLQQRHQADLELIESAHRNRIKVLETSYQQREERLQRENEELSTRFLSHCQEAEQARTELTAQHQRRLAAAEQEKDQEMERLRELQRASILEMRKDHEEQLQRLRLLKDREIDAVTSATSHTRSLNGVIEQMEKFSSSLNELSSRVEASHVTTTQERELGIRQQDEQLRALQDRLGRQQRDMEEERSRLHEIIGKMEARLNEQSRLLEQERWRMTSEQSKVESTQRALEEQRKVTAQQIAMEREELERAKSALLEEQKAVMHKCGEERRRLAADWAEFSAQQKLSKERAEREAERALQMDTQREGTLISLAKEQAELKIKASELRAKEDQLAAEREALERERRDLRLEKERISAAALRLRLRAEEVEGMSQVASDKYEEGERALREARQVQSEQQARLQRVQQQQEQLRKQEQHVHQEHLSLAQQRFQLNQVRQDLPSNPMRLLPQTQGLAASSLNAIVTPAPTAHCLQTPAGPVPSHLHAKLVLLKHTAKQDHDFLENEQFFLETLKKASYNLTSQSM